MKSEEEEHCGWDHNTHIGIACDGEPNKAWVCGTCGILYDVVYPTGLKTMVTDEFIGNAKGDTSKKDKKNKKGKKEQPKEEAEQEGQEGQAELEGQEEQAEQAEDEEQEEQE